MAKEGRDDKGRFLKGRKPPTGNQFNEGNASEMQSRSADARKDNRIVATALRNALLSRDPETGDPTIVAIVKGVTSRSKKQGSMGDIRIAADILGELEQKVAIEGEMNFTFKFGDE